MDLRIACQPAADVVTLVIVRMILAELAREFRTFRAWSDKTHVPPENIPKLRQFIDAVSSERQSDTCTPRIVGDGPDSAKMFFGIFAHCPEFEDREETAFKSDSNLTEEYGSAVA